MKEPRRDYQNSVFVSLFGREDKKYLLKLYKALHPEDVAVSKDDLDIITIENVLTNGIYNDLGFIARKKGSSGVMVGKKCHQPQCLC